MDAVEHSAVRRVIDLTRRVDDAEQCPGRRVLDLTRLVDMPSTVLSEVIDLTRLVDDAEHCPGRRVCSNKQPVELPVFKSMLKTCLFRHHYVIQRNVIMVMVMWV